MNFIVANRRPFCLVLLCGCVGYFFGSFVTGLVIGATIVCLVTLIF